MAYYIYHHTFNAHKYWTEHRKNNNKIELLLSQVKNEREDSKKEKRSTNE